MVSTRNTSRSNTNPPRMQDQPSNADNRPPGMLEAMQANTNEVEALCLTNRRLIEELEQLTRQMQCPQATRRAQEDYNFPPPPPPPPPPPLRSNTISTFPEVLKKKQNLTELGGMDPNWPLKRRAMEKYLESMLGTENYATLNKEQENYHESRGSTASSKNSAV